MTTSLYPRFRTKRNRLTAYSFACGYIETRISGTVETQLWHEGACFHVRQFSYACGYPVRLFWECFDTLTEARRFFDKQPGKIASESEQREWYAKVRY